MKFAHSVFLDGVFYPGGVEIPHRVVAKPVKEEKKIIEKSEKVEPEVTRRKRKGLTDEGD